MTDGWIKIHRKILDSQIYPSNRPFTKYEAWLDLLLVVNFKDTEVLIGNEPYVCKRGQSIRSIETYQKRWCWTRQQVRSFFDLLKKISMIELKTTSKTTILTICNYDTYQGEQPAETQKLDDNRVEQTTTIETTNDSTMLQNSTSDSYKDEQPAEQPTKQPLIKNDIKNDKREKFTPPSLQEIQSYFSEKIKEKGLLLSPTKEAERFEDYYSMVGWEVGKNKRMKDWKAAIRYWLKNSYSSSQSHNGKPIKQLTPTAPKDLTGIW